MARNSPEFAIPRPHFPFLAPLFFGHFEMVPRFPKFSKVFRHCFRPLFGYDSGMTNPLFPVPARPAGPLRELLAGRLDALRADGHDLPDDLALVTLSLADRIDAANAGGDRRGFVMLTAEYRAARRDLLEGLDDAGTDPLDAAIAAFRASEGHHPTEPVPID